MSYPQIVSITPGITGLVGVLPTWISIDTHDSIAAVTTAGYLNAASYEHAAALNNKTVALVSTVNAGVTSAAWYQVSVTGTPGDLDYSLVAL